MAKNEKQGNKTPITQKFKLEVYVYKNGSFDLAFEGCKRIPNKDYDKGTS